MSKRRAKKEARRLAEQRLVTLSLANLDRQVAFAAASGPAPLGDRKLDVRRPR